METSENGILAGLIGHRGAKAVLRAALRSGESHVLLTGPPASGKSVALEAVSENVPGAEYHDASGFSSAELRETFRLSPSVLCLDEIDSMGAGCYDVLQMPMEQGRVTKSTRTESYDVAVDSQIVAACNTSSELPAQITSRFREIGFEEYDLEAYLRVCGELLIQEAEWISDKYVAWSFADDVYVVLGTLDVRDPRDAARMTRGYSEAMSVVRGIDDPNADVESDPILPGELDDDGGGEQERQEPNYGIQGVEGITVRRRQGDEHDDSD